MFWSRYNFVFRSERHGGLLYNALTNSFLAVPDAFYGRIADLKEGDPFDCDDLGLSLQLMAAGALVESGEDDRRRDVLRLRMRERAFSTDYPRLIIAPTMSCNCACPYCFEKSHAPVHMDERTEDALVEFARRFLPARVLLVTWFGGEPLLRFDQIRRLTGKLRQLPFKGYNATLITNGTLLTDEVITHLEELAIKMIQITLDGPQETHDSRRKLATGGGTYETILGNLDALFRSDWTGRVRIRVNLDRTNKDQYAEIYRCLKDRYRDYADRIHIYSGITVYHDTVTNPDYGCGLPPDEFAAFALDELKTNGIETRFSYPELASFGCLATALNAFVVGPTGDLYKCLETLGDRKMRVGSVFPDEPWNNELLARFMEGENALNDPKCLACKCFPICDGGCPHMRILGGNACAYFKNYLPQLLEAYWERKIRQKEKKTDE